jgi:histone acetyltransferase (RNA polymerase elongator complex component)
MEAITIRSTRYPLYEMIVDTKPKWCEFNEAVQWYNSGWNQVEFGRQVIDSIQSHPRPMTIEERLKISRAADELSDNK